MHTALINCFDTVIYLIWYDYDIDIVMLLITLGIMSGLH